MKTRFSIKWDLFQTFRDCLMFARNGGRENTHRNDEE